MTDKEIQQRCKDEWDMQVEIFRSCYAKGYNDAKREIAMSGEYERAYERGEDELQNALLAIDKWHNDQKAKVFHGDLGAIAILRNHTAQYIVTEVRRYQAEQAAMASMEKIRKTT